jgi:hypothetical protein
MYFQFHLEPVRQNNKNNFDSSKQVTLQGGYEPAQYANLAVSAELKDLFKIIQR